MRNSASSILAQHCLLLVQGYYRARFLVRLPPTPEIAFFCHMPQDTNSGIPVKMTLLFVQVLIHPACMALLYRLHQRLA